MNAPCPMTLSAANTRNRLLLLIVLMVGPVPASAREPFDLRFDHSTVLVTDLETSAAFYGRILHLEPLETPGGPKRTARRLPAWGAGPPDRMATGLMTHVSGYPVRGAVRCARADRPLGGLDGTVRSDSCNSPSSRHRERASCSRGG
jgi:hypothetical protein